MKNKLSKSIFLGFILSFVFAFTADVAGITDDIALTIRTGNSKDLAKYFNTNLDLTIPGYTGSCSKSQAEIIIKDFFKKYPPKTFTIIHQGASTDGAQYSIGSMNSGSMNFRVYFLLKKFSEKFFIQQLRFEQE